MQLAPSGEPGSDSCAAGWIEKRAREELTASAIERLEALGLLGAIDERATRAELRDLQSALDALEELQAWVEAELAEASAA